MCNPVLITLKKNKWGKVCNSAEAKFLSFKNMQDYNIKFFDILSGKYKTVDVKNNDKIFLNFNYNTDIYLQVKKNTEVQVLM